MAIKPAGARAKSDANVARALARAYWREIIRQTNPAMSEDDLKANWAQAQGQYMKLGRKVLRTLERGGYKLQKAE